SVVFPCFTSVPQVEKGSQSGSHATGRSARVAAIRPEVLVRRSGETGTWAWAKAAATRRSRSDGLLQHLGRNHGVQPLAHEQLFAADDSSDHRLVAVHQSLRGHGSG